LIAVTSGALLLGTSCLPTTRESADPDRGDACDHLDACAFPEPAPGFCDSDCHNVVNYECPRIILSESCDELRTRGFGVGCEPRDGGTPAP
jgi:hypothetical protein